MPRQSASIRVVSDHADRFTSTDRQVRDEVDLEIWGEKQRGIRTDQIDLKLGCSPKRVADALQRLKDLKPRPTGGINGLEKWQYESLLEMHQKKPPVEYKASGSRRLLEEEQDKEDRKHTRPPKKGVSTVKNTTIVLDKDEDDTSPPALRTQNKPAPNNQPAFPAPKPRKDKVLLNRIKAKIARPPETRPVEVPIPARQKITGAAKTLLEASAAQNMIETVIHNTKLEFETTDDDLRSRNDTDFRARAYRLSILLVLNFFGVLPETAAGSIGRDKHTARILFDIARGEVLNQQLPLPYFAAKLCNRLGISFEELTR